MTCPNCGSHRGLILSYGLFALWVKCYGCSKVLYVRDNNRIIDIIENENTAKITWDIAMRPLKEKYEQTFSYT